ncbi:MAG: hypothetical protein O2954_18830 [bacterium]|nr:hypothetical protein [bacterium]
MESETLWNRIKQGFLESASTAAEKAEHLGRVGRARLDIAGARHAIHEAFAELGGMVYTHLESDKTSEIAQQKSVQAQIRKINDLETLLQERETVLETLKTRTETEQPGAAET